MPLSPWIEAEGGVEHPDGEVEVGFGNQCADLDLTGGDREQVDLPFGERLEHRRCKLGVGADADADDADLGDGIVVNQFFVSDLGPALLDHRHCL